MLLVILEKYTICSIMAQQGCSDSSELIPSSVWAVLISGNRRLWYRSAPNVSGLPIAKDISLRGKELEITQKIREHQQWNIRLERVKTPVVQASVSG